MDVQRPRPNPALSEVPSPIGNPKAPADSITGAMPDLGQPAVQSQLPATQQSNKVKKKRTGLIVGIVTAVVVLLIGLGVGGFIWYKSSSKPAPAVTPTETPSDRVGVEEIDATTAEIDKTMNTLDDSTDVTPGDVTDSTLGL